MIPLVKLAGNIGFLNHMWGAVLCYFGFGVSLNLFLYHGFIKSIPVEVEEAAIVDGSSTYGVFWRIIFPLLKPMTVTIILLNSLWVWNDFLPLLIIGGQETRTIPLATYAFSWPIHEAVGSCTCRTYTWGAANYRVLPRDAEAHNRRDYSWIG